MKRAFIILLAGLGGLCPRADGAESAAHPEQSGANHWAFIPPSRPAVPAVRQTKWVRNPIDAFVLARLEREGFAPSPEADRRTLIRRLSLDLLGLPPSLEEIRAFVSDSAADAYERLVDRLLASPHFGEQWGRHWLDLARYADSDGYEKDGVRPYAYLYRDWVIRAVNRDLPFDQFTIEQLAGDLLPEASVEQQKATGFHRQTLTNREGGVDAEEFRCKATVDRANTTASVWLGLTAACAECHAHKYDPISQREYFQFYAFFNQADEAHVAAPEPEEWRRYNDAKSQWSAEYSRHQAALDSYLEGPFQDAVARWTATNVVSSTRWTPIVPVRVEAISNTSFRIETNGLVIPSGEVPLRDTYRVKLGGPFTNLTGLRLDLLDDPATNAGPGRSKTGAFVLSDLTVEVAAATGAARQITLTNAVATAAQAAMPLAATLDGDARTGWAIGLAQRDRDQAAAFTFGEDVTVPADGHLRVTLAQQHGRQMTVGRFKLSVTMDPRPAGLQTLPDAVVAALRAPAGQRTPEQRATIAAHVREFVDETARELDRQLAECLKKHPKFPETRAAVLGAAQTSRVTRVHLRGDFLQPGDVVEPGTFAVLHRFQPRRQPADRLDLAHWLVAPENPLTARVTVNHVWRHLFGRGLVATENDFGTRGERPSHPELLDWLATVFVSPDRAAQGCGWSRKKLIRLIVTSAAYRQGSAHRDDLAAVDPHNVLLARQSRFRVPAENVRDLALAAGGLLHRAVGGPPIRPPLPADIAALGYADSVKWTESAGPDRYRRGLYIFFQRTVPYPGLMLFDMPDSNVTCTRRERSNTPLQALTLLNDPVFVEAARALGRWMDDHGGATESQKIAAGFERCLARPPSDAERSRLLQLYADQLRLIEASPQKAPEIAGDKTPAEATPGRAALILVARAMMNLDEFVTRE